MLKILLYVCTIFCTLFSQQKTYFLPNIFYDIAGGDDYNSYSAAGIILGPIIIPLYQSWEEVGQSAKNAKWISDRVRLQFNFNLASLLQ